MDLALNNLQRLLCHKTQTNNQLYIYIHIYIYIYTCICVCVHINRHIHTYIHTYTQKESLLTLIGYKTIIYYYYCYIKGRTYFKSCTFFLVNVKEPFIFLLGEYNLWVVWSWVGEGSTISSWYHCFYCNIQLILNAGDLVLKSLFFFRKFTFVFFHLFDLCFA